MRKWKEQELATWIEARLADSSLPIDERLLVARALARHFLESPEISIRFHSPAQVKRKGRLTKPHEPDRDPVQ